ncbi:MAG: beta-N-acetylhexosaminidase [Sulfuriferula sp.]|nr:beta-N-acetylhexosaminidase [Sulfuriferula sp.]
MSLGPVMVDVPGLVLTDDDRQRLLHPLVGGVILFKRNYESPAQLIALTSEIRALRQPHLLIAVDHEGGRVQRFRDGFTVLPAMRELGRIWEHNPAQARHLAQDCGYVLAAELRAHGVDLSFTPVLDLDYGESGVIGDRAFHVEPHVVGDLAHALMLGLKEAGMGSVGKHFPGHGYVRADSHLAIPVDERSWHEIEQADLIPFARLVADGMTGIMPAHVIYPAVDAQPAGFSSVWLQRVLREQLGFNGVIFSDDLSMEGASVAGDIVQRTQAALDAGCDMALVCNNCAAADAVLHGLRWQKSASYITRFARLHGRAHPLDMTALHEQARYVEAVRRVVAIGQDNSDLWARDATNSCGLSGLA